MKFWKQILAGAFVLALTFTALPAHPSMAEDTGTYHSTLLFTHDMHSHFLPAADESGKISGGFAKLSTLLKEQRSSHPDALTVDAGDFSMGSLFQSVYATDALELKMMGELGYDATTFGNHEFDFRPEGLSAMLQSAADSGESLPQIVEANYAVPKKTDPGYDQTDADLQEAMDDYGVLPYTIIHRGGIAYGIFGIMGEDANADAPLSGMILSDAVETARNTVEEIRSQVEENTPLFIICLSHAGTNPDPKYSEDETLAKRVDGIDVIVSGHSHTTLSEPIEVNDTLIVSAGCYSANLGVLTVDWEKGVGKTGFTYELLPVDDTVPEDPKIAKKIEACKKDVEEGYLAQFGFTGFDEVIGRNSLSFDTVEEVESEHRESGLGNLIADAYVYAVTKGDKKGDVPAPLAVTASGVIRSSFLPGDITVSDVYNVSSLGIGTDGLSGYPLVEVWLTGREIKAACEVDASVQALMPNAQLHISGLTFTWNPHRMFFNKVVSANIQNEDGSLSELEDDRLYRIVTGLYCAQMLSAVKNASFGFLSITPKYADGSEIRDFDDCIIYDENGNEIKEWYALASYIASFDSGEIPERYSQENATTRKVEVDDVSPGALLKSANVFTGGVIGIAVLLLALVVFIILHITRRGRSKLGTEQT